MEIIRHYMVIQTLQFLTRLPTRQDGVENRDKVYKVLIQCYTVCVDCTFSRKEHCVFSKGRVRIKELIVKRSSYVLY